MACISITYYDVCLSYIEMLDIPKMPGIDKSGHTFFGLVSKIVLLFGWPPSSSQITSNHIARRCLIDAGSGLVRLVPL